MGINMEKVKEILQDAESDIATLFEEALGEQPYEVRCEECGNVMDIMRKEVDCYNDLLIRVARCTCADHD